MHVRRSCSGNLVVILSCSGHFPVTIDEWVCHYGHYAFKAARMRGNEVLSYQTNLSDTILLPHSNRMASVLSTLDIGHSRSDSFSCELDGIGVSVHQ